MRHPNLPHCGSLVLAALGLAATSNGRDTKSIPSFVRQSIEARINQDAPVSMRSTNICTLIGLSLQEKETGQRMADELKRAGSRRRHWRAWAVRSSEERIRPDGSGAGRIWTLLPVKANRLAVPSGIQAKNERGETVSVMHACGHDVHMTVFAERRGFWRNRRRTGRHRRHGWPARRGARQRREVDAGQRPLHAFPKPDYCLALHASANLRPAPWVTSKAFALANVDSVNVTIRGVGGRGSGPIPPRMSRSCWPQAVLAFRRSSAAKRRRSNPRS